MELSLVMCDKNNNYGGEIYREVEPAVPTPQKERSRLSFKTLHEAFKDFDYEVIFVEWNPDPDKERVRDWDFMQHPRIRVIEVPPIVAKAAAPGMDFHEMWGKNIGIRRAKGDVIIGTNNDVLWLNQMPRNILSIKDRAGVVISYRWTVFHPVLEFMDNLDKVREFCFNPKNRIDYDINSNGDFTMMSKHFWYQLEGYSITQDNKIAGCDMWQVERAFRASGIKNVLPFPIYHVRHPGKPLDSGYGITNVSPDFGMVGEIFDEYINGKLVQIRYE